MKQKGDIKMNELTILHLSDLHIDGNNNGYSRLLQELICDISQEIVYINDKSLIVTVTGDTLHRGPQVATNDLAVSNAFAFFKDLHNVIKEKVIGIYIVPGNHDKYRSNENAFLVQSYREMTKEYFDETTKATHSKFDLNFYKNFWNYHYSTYTAKTGSGYIELTQKVYQLFGITEANQKNKSFIQDTFGVDKIEIGGRNYCFVLLNTSWSCADDDDSRNLILGDFQIGAIKKQFLDLNNSTRPDLTIVLGHHPLGALIGKEEDKVFTEMISFESLDANVYLCGHTHDRTVNNMVNVRHSLNTFVSGIGWPENQSGAHVGSHTYSMYVFNMDINSVDVYVRSTNDGGAFSPDFRIYNTQNTANLKKLVFPICAQAAQTYLPIMVPRN